MKKILMIQWFNCKDHQRKLELIECINHNLELGFDEVIIHNHNVEINFNASNIKNEHLTQRLTYKHYVNAVNDPQNYGSLIILANTDIKLDEKMLTLHDTIPLETLIALTRYEINGELADSPWCTQDVWAMLSQPLHKSIVNQCDIQLGLPGCELRFSEVIYSAGFSVYNPCLDIQNIHIHSNPNPHLDENRMFGTYLFTPACKLIDLQNHNDQIKPTLHYLNNGALKSKL
jgi:hypothetical protein